MGNKQKDRVQGSGEPCEGGHCTCGCNEAAMESDPLLKDMMELDALERQIGGEHYKTMAIQPITYIMANDLGWCEGNAIKYVTRFKQKGGRQDIEKAIHYLQILLDSIE